jgi:type IV pilus assembly protein PilA
MPFCQKCGNALAEGSQFCKFCGSPISPAAPPLTAGAAGPQPTSGKAIASMILGFFFFLLPTAIAAIVLGHMSLSEIKKSAGRLQGQGMAIAGLVLGYAGVAALPVILIIAAIAIPNLLRARIAANEASAVGSLRMLNSAEVAFAASNPKQGYTCSLSDLSGLNTDLASVQNRGYVFELTGCSAEEPGGAKVKYQIVAYPQNGNQTGVRAFCSDDTMEIRFDPQGSSAACLEHGTTLQR